MGTELNEALREFLVEEDTPGQWERACPYCGKLMRERRPYCSQECSMAAIPTIAKCHYPEEGVVYEVIQ